ncbi:MAG: hypothetical protein FJZ01_00925 [Candidatus Sericytochromatia bacterium]|nr:hypothetical protein [Candidatus Tanganyikabacteria bacterium]
MDAQGTPHDLLTNLVVTAELQAELDGALDGLLREGGADSAALVERSGLTLAAKGGGRTAHPAVGALVGGIFKSLKTLSGLMGEYAIRELMQKGPHSYTALILLETDDLLVATFPSERLASQVDVPLKTAAGRLAMLMSSARQQRAPVQQGGLLDASSIDDALGNF